MEFRDLKRQYNCIKDEVNERIRSVIESSHFIQGEEVSLLEQNLKEYVGVKHCITCANGTDALQLALMAWSISRDDAVFVPDFTFFSTGEVVSAVGATPIFVDVKKDTFNMDPDSLERMIKKTAAKDNLKLKAVIAVDLFGLPAEYDKIREICDKYNLFLLEDGAQGFGGRFRDKKACSFGDISTTSFFPAKPLGCYGDGGAVFTDNDEWAALIRSYCVHGKGADKYDNVRIGMNSRLDEIQAAVLNVKLPVFIEKELELEQEVAKEYTTLLSDTVKVPSVYNGYYSSWAQYTIQMKDLRERETVQTGLKEKGIPSMVYYRKPMHIQKAFGDCLVDDNCYKNSIELSETVLSIPFNPYMELSEVKEVAEIVNVIIRRKLS